MSDCSSTKSKCSSSSSDSSSDCSSSSSDSSKNKCSSSSSSSDSCKKCSSSSSSTCTCSSSSSSSDSSSSSSDSSSSSSSCGKDKYPRAYEKYKHDRKKCALSAPDIFYQNRGAVVAIETLTTVNNDVAVSNIGSGFFVSNNHIVTAASVVLLSGRRNRRVPAPPSPPAPYIVRVSRIFVHVANVNGTDKNLIYEADLIGLDGAADIALLHIGEILNCDLPKLKCQNYLQFDRSRDYCIGRNAFTIANDVGDDAQTIRAGVIVNNRQFNKQQGRPPTELVVVDFGVYTPSNFGAPILDEHGHVIGLINQTYQGSSGSVTAGLSEFFMKRILDALHVASNALVNGTKIKCYANNLQLVVDPVGNYYRYIKGFLGIQWTQYSPLYFLNGTTSYKKTQGIIVTGVDVSTPLGAIFQTLIDAGNNILITDIDGCPIGNIPNQITPADVTWRKSAGDKVKLEYRVSSDNFGRCQSLTVQLGVFPDQFDTPNNFWMALPPTSSDSSVAVVEVTSTKSDSKDTKSDSKDTKSDTISLSSAADTAKSSKIKVCSFKRYSKDLKAVNQSCMNCRVNKGNCGKCKAKEYIA